MEIDLVGPSGLLSKSNTFIGSRAFADNWIDTTCFEGLLPPSLSHNSFDDDIPCIYACYPNHCYYSSNYIFLSFIFGFFVLAGVEYENSKGCINALNRLNVLFFAPYFFFASIVAPSISFQKVSDDESICRISTSSGYIYSALMTVVLPLLMLCCAAVNYFEELLIKQSIILAYMFFSVILHSQCGPQNWVYTRSIILLLKIKIRLQYTLCNLI